MTRVCFLSFEAVADQPRIRRQGDALHDAGYEVVAVGRSGARTPAPEWPVRELPFARLSGAARLRAMFAQLLSPLAPAVAMWGYWTDERRRQLLDATLAERPDIVVAREWRTLPVAMKVRERTGARVVMDSPELSSEELVERRIWRWFFRPTVTAIEGRFLPVLDLVTAVNGPIADALQQEYGLRHRPLVVRNVPPYETHALRPIGAVTKAIYLGGLAPGRGLEAVIDSVAAWPTNWTLTMMGPAEPAYLAGLRERAARAGDRIIFRPPVPLTEMVAEAAHYDVGIFAHQPNGRQADLALPNKLFEYLMAGLAVCVSDMTAMREVVAQTGAGVLIEAPFDAEAVTRAVVAMASADLMSLKERALAAAHLFNWEQERDDYVAAVRAIAEPL